MNVPNVLPQIAVRTVRRPAVPQVGSRIFTHVVLIAVGAVVAYPFYYMVTTGLKDFFEAIVGGDPDPIELLRAGDERAVRDLIAAAQASAVPSPA